MKQSKGDIIKQNQQTIQKPNHQNKTAKLNQSNRKGNQSHVEQTNIANHHTLLDSQSSIGWSQILSGRFSVEWARLQELHIDEEKIDSRYFSGKTWSTKATQHIWCSLHDLWKVRNTALHGETFTESEATCRTRIEPLVRRL